MVDRLLASPQYGVRWAQHWLDLAHYADTDGFEHDANRPDAWRYRDWLVDALNSDMPFDRFVQFQIAGDELLPGDSNALIATGFLRCGPRLVARGNVDLEVKRQSELTEVTGTVGSVFMGLTMACARCHDHKFDPLPTTDYYRLQAFFSGANFDDVSLENPLELAMAGSVKAEVESRVEPFARSQQLLESSYRDEIRRRKENMLSEAERALLAIPPKDRSPTQKKQASGLANSIRVTWEDVAAAVAENEIDFAKRETLKREIFELRLGLPSAPSRAMAVAEKAADWPKTYVNRRGDVHNKGPLVEPRPPGVLLASFRNHAFADPPSNPTAKRRIRLAQWMTDSKNPLVARVIVNRLWQRHFGKGIVTTPSDFGLRGEPPTHPELLDWLVHKLVEGSWRLKPLHKLMVMSATYRQASNVRNAKAQDLDPENALLWRMNRRRLDAESIRDGLLAVSGEINLELGGPGVRGPLEPEVKSLIFTEDELVELWPETRDARLQAKRSLYLYRKRNVRYPLFDAFDAPDTQSPCPERSSSTHAIQALSLFNGEFAVSRAQALAGRVFRESEASDESRIVRLYRIVYNRDPRRSETTRALAFLDSQGRLLEDRRADALVRPLPPRAEVCASQAGRVGRPGNRHGEQQ